LSRKKLQTPGPIEVAGLEKLVANKNILLKTRRIKGHAGISGKKLADMAANTAF
jgi:hypothetical protein